MLPLNLDSSWNISHPDPWRSNLQTCEIWAAILSTNKIHVTFSKFRTVMFTKISLFLYKNQHFYLVRPFVWAFLSFRKNKSVNTCKILVTINFGTIYCQRFSSSALLTTPINWLQLNCDRQRCKFIETLVPLKIVNLWPCNYDSDRPSLLKFSLFIWC